MAGEQTELSLSCSFKLILEAVVKWKLYIGVPAVEEKWQSRLWRLYRGSWQAWHIFQDGEGRITTCR